MLNSGGNKTNESLNTDVIQCDVTPEILHFFLVMVQIIKNSVNP
jgi:hypothetical protein